MNGEPVGEREGDKETNLCLYYTHRQRKKQTSRFCSCSDQNGFVLRITVTYFSLNSYFLPHFPFFLFYFSLQITFLLAYSLSTRFSLSPISCLKIPILPYVTALFFSSFSPSFFFVTFSFTLHTYIGKKRYWCYRKEDRKGK